MRVVVSIGGSVLVPDDGPDRVAAYASAIEDLLDDGHTVAVVVGGGPTAREYIERARDLGANEIELDEIGIAVTRLNARLLIAALDERATTEPPRELLDARAALRRGDIPVMGGTEPAHTTDAVAAALAEYVEADKLVLATSVPGVYDADPGTDPDATRYEELAAGDLIDLITSIRMDAGSNAPVDLLAAKIIERAGLPTAVVDGTDPSSLAAAVAGDHDGTAVVPGAEIDG